MAISVQNNAYTTKANAYAPVAKDEAHAAPAKVQPQTQDTAASNPKQDTFVKSPEYKMDTEKVNAMKADLAGNMAAFRQMVQNLLNRQGKTAYTAIGELLNIDEATRQEARAAIAEDGYWGVQQTATRILDFARALSGGDPDKIPQLREAVQKGYEAAEKAWGGTLPPICAQTKDAVLQGFDEWAAAEPDTQA